MPARLTNLDGAEVSTVGKAANKRRFLVLKGDQYMIDETKALAAVSKIAKAGLGDALEALAGSDAKDIDEILKAAGVPEAEMDRARAAARVMGPELVAKAFPPAKDEEEAEEKIECKKCQKGLAKGATSCPSCGQAVEKSATALLKAASDEISELRTRLEKSEQEATRVASERRRETFIQKAAEVKHLPGAVADDLGAILEKCEKALGAADFGRLFQILKAADAVVQDSALFGELGSAASGLAVAGAYAKIDAAAADLRKADPSLSIERARARIIKAHPELYAEYQAELDARKKR